jgi:O-antigen/teichoic acid export membrane protein
VNNFKHGTRGITAVTLAKKSIPYVMASIIVIMYMQMDKALLIRLLAPKEIGWYVAAFAAASSVNVLNSSLGIVQFSSAARAEGGCGFQSLAVTLRRGAILTCAGGGVLLLLLPFLIPLVYGKEFQPAVVISCTLLPGLVLAGLGNIINESHSVQGNPISGVVSKIFGLIVMAFLGIWLSGYYGAQGIAFGYLGGETVVFSGLVFVAVRYYNAATYKELLPTAEDISFLYSHFKRRCKKG